MFVDLENAPHETQPGTTAQGTSGSYQPYTPPSGPSTIGMAGKIGLSVIGIVVLVGLIYFLYGGFVQKVTPPPPPPVSVTTNVTPLYRFRISSCMSITSPGVYRIASNISTAQTDGPCISIESSNVALLGNGREIEGSGPYVQTSPYSYGIAASNVTNVTIANVTVRKFSYDIFMSKVASSQVYNANVLNATISGIYLFNSSRNAIHNNRVSAASSTKGGIGMTGGGNNTVSNNLAVDNAYYGLWINSSNNAFRNDTVNQNPIDLACGSNSNLRYSNQFQGSSCSVNYYCNFAYCSKTNIPSTLNFTVSNPITGCGVISSPGDYKMASSLNLSSYVNTSNPSATSTCLTIKSPNVYLNCQNNTIYNAGHGIYASGIYNAIISNCRFYNNTYGIYLANSFNDNVSGGRATRGKYALYLDNETSTAVSDVNYTRNVYGIYINNSSSATFSNDSTVNNTYGIYYASGSTSSFFSSKLNLNNNMDLFCSPKTYNSSFEIFQGNSCGLTDCNWASCSKHVLVALANYPIFSCGVISVPGNYTLQSVLLSNTKGSCITINASNINFDCNGKFLQGGRIGNAFRIVGRDNITLSNCAITQYKNAVNATDTKFLNLLNFTVHNVTNGIVLSGTNFSRINSVKESDFGGTGFSISGMNNSVLTNDSASSGVNGATGFMISGSHKNIITYDTASNNPGYGFFFNNSRANLIRNNSALSNSNFDYSCSGGSQGIYSNTGIVNTGITKDNCIWMVESNPLVTPVCYAISKSSYIGLQQDMLYTYGGTCYTAFNTNSSTARESTINCNGHTIYSTSGGTFANVKNASTAVIENCYLRGFSKAIISSAQYTSLLNDTIVNSNYSVILSNATYPTIRGSSFANDTYGIYSQNSKYGTIQSDTFTNVSNAIYLLSGSAFKLFGNTVRSAEVGAALINTQLNQLQGNILNGTVSGITCSQFATNQSSNGDLGGNSCSSNNKCSWMSSSTACLS